MSVSKRICPGVSDMYFSDNRHIGDLRSSIFTAPVKRLVFSSSVFHASDGRTAVFFEIKRLILAYTDSFRSLCRKMRADMKTIPLFLASVLMLNALQGCIDPIPQDGDDDYGYEEPSYGPPLSEIASLLSELPLSKAHVVEVHDAVSSSSVNGYDEEYTMANLFSVPGSGVGDARLPSKAAPEYDYPLSELIRDHLTSRAKTRAAGAAGPEPGSVSDDAGAGIGEEVDRYLDVLASTDIQIYWPFSDGYEGTLDTLVITFDPEDASTANVGYKLAFGDDGTARLHSEVVVDETVASEMPVWVVNRNSDDEYLTLDMIRQLYPGWTDDGGSIVINPGKKMATRAGETAGLKTLVLKDFTMLRNYDSWFAGASEFFVKCGSVENFTASTEAELQLYSPSVTDFMVVVKRNQVGIPQPFNAVLVSDWTGQMENCAFMIVEDDGGKQTSWKCTALVRIESKSYGVELDLPFKTRDDIVWRGSLSRRFIETYDGTPSRFGDVNLTFEIVGPPETSD